MTHEKEENNGEKDKEKEEHHGVEDKHKEVKKEKKIWNRSVYKTDYTWPPIYERTAPSLFIVDRKEHCKAPPRPPCVCEAQFCICRQKKKRKGEPERVEDDPDAFTYLKGVKTLYQETYSREGYELDLGFPPNDPCPKPNSPIARIWNPFLVPRDAFRPHQPRPLGCPLTFESVTVPVNYTRTKQEPQPSLCDIREMLLFPQKLQNKISLKKLKEQKFGMSRERPRAVRKIF